MARAARKKSKTGIYHVMLRGINKQIIFEDNEDMERFLLTLRSFKDKGSYKLFAFCLMNNHVHILLRELGEDISVSIKKICASYVLWYNKKYERCGHLFQERFKSETVENDSYFLTVLKYIHQNPLKAGVVKEIEDYKWSSYNEYMLDRKNKITDLDFGLAMFSADRKEAIDLFIEYHREGCKDKCLDYEDFVNLADEEVIAKANMLGINNIAMLQSLDRGGRDSLLRELMKIDGVTIRQLARITGVSKSVIGRAHAQKT